MGATMQPQIAGVVQPPLTTSEPQDSTVTAPATPTMTTGNLSPSPHVGTIPLVPTTIPVDRTGITMPPHVEEIPPETTGTTPSFNNDLGSESTSCTPVNGVYGSTDSDMTEDISFLYQVEMTSSSPEAMRQLGVLEDAFTTAMIPLLFPSSCGGGPQRRHLAMATVVGITSTPPDLVIVDRQCEPLVDPSNTCVVIDGRFRVFSNGSEPPAHLVPVLHAKLRTEMAQGAFNDATDDIVRVSTFTEPHPISPTGDASSATGGAAIKSRSMSMIGAMVGVFGTALLLLACLARRQWGIRRSQKQGEAILQSQLARRP